MSQAVLLGTPGTKRTVYLEKGVQEAGIRIELLDWNLLDWSQGLPLPWPFEDEKMFLKIDPPLWNSCCLEELNALAGEYEGKLKWLAEAGKAGKITFLNQPEDIGALLDKQGCKRTLVAAGIPVTEELNEWEQGESKKEAPENQSFNEDSKKWDSEKSDSGNGNCGVWKPGDSPAERLMETMEKSHVHQVFIKPLLGSGAAGVAAFRIQPRSGQVVLYTCAMEDPETGRLVNTKRLRRFTDRNQVLSMINRLLELGCVVERWYAKAEHQGCSYDLRAVVQDGQMDFLLARLSSGPITNLHLNNHPLKGEELGLSPKVRESVEELCIRAAGCYPGLRSVGIDILLEKGSLRPRIIEMNGQGDLIYQDIYDKNRIYRHQAEMMKEWLWRNTQ